MFNSCHLKNALVKKFMMDECLTNLLTIKADGTSQTGVDPWTLQPRVQVAETSPATISESPFVGIDILNVKPLVFDSITHWYESDVMIAVNSHDSLRTTQIADVIQHILTVAPEDFDKPAHSYCCDLSDECIRTRKVRFTDRPKMGKAGVNKYDSETNDWYETLYLEVIWSPRPCDYDSECDETIFSPCPIVTQHLPEHPLCRCPNE